jgi:hypothetical protein
MRLSIDQNRNVLIYQAAYVHYSFESQLPCPVAEPYLKPVVVEFHALEPLSRFATFHFLGNLFRVCP